MKKIYNIQELWLRIVEKSDEKAFEELFYALNSRLIKFGLFYVHQKEVAEEIVSDVFVKVWTQRQDLKHVRKAETYLFISVKNLALNHIKKFSSIHIVALEDSTLHLVDTHCPDVEMEKRELIFKLNQAIDSLPRQCRIIFRLVKDDGMKYKDVALILGISQRTVQTQLFRAMKKLNLIMLPYIKSDLLSPNTHILLSIAFFVLLSLVF
ncbi:RNA polymerase sigma-70 factor [Pararcticibacter amylolyticus]|uniref:RNA polymerase sigma-70 factor n=1 Tax=Pararcticibacter amylolyticus TaxID=2173175 RepID=UPI001304E565|nr:RNA polymerase sigma-70 factor [Pararcticibacter amylolyticus]